MLCSMHAGLKAFADSVKKRSDQMKENAMVEPRSAREKNIAAEVSRIAATCHKPRPVGGIQLRCFQ